MKTKLLALALACFMVISMLPVSIFAAEHEHACPGEDEKHTLELCPDATLVEVVPSQCGEWGYTLYACPDCGDYFADDFNKVEGNHTWKVTAEAVDATCTKDGKTLEETCEVCGKKQGGEVVKAAGHKWKVTKTDGDCLTGGFVYETCENCDAEQKTPIEGTGKGHTWSENPVKIEKEPTWNEKGLAVYECTVCGATKKVDILPEHDHALKEHKYVAPTCTEDGSEAYWECTICGVYFADENATTEFKVKTDKDGKPIAGAYDTVIPALGHITEGVEVKEEMAPTCSEEGWKLVVCGRCEKDVTVVIEATGHSFEEDKPVKILPTCTAWGFDVYACTVCGYVKRTNPVEPLKHTPYEYPALEEGEEVPADRVYSYNQWEITPTCTTAGERNWNCGRCGEAQREILLATGHATVTVKVEATCSKFNYEYTYCANDYCTEGTYSWDFNENGVLYLVAVNNEPVWLLSYKVGTQLNPNKHTLDEGAINYPTCTEPGDKVGYCVDCNEYFTEVMPATGHKYEFWFVSQPQGCETDEIEMHICWQCGSLKEVTTDKTKTGHKFPKTGTTYAPTCSAKGYTEFICETCGYADQRDFTDYEPRTEYTAEQAEAEHLGLGEAIEVFREGDCLTIGLYRHFCYDCGEYILVVIDGTGEGHYDDGIYEELWLGTEFPALAPTCTEKGYTAEYFCPTCGTWIESVEIPATGHDWKDATCTVAKTCKTCGATDGEALGHDWETIPEVPATCDKAGVSEYKVCNRDCCKDEKGNKLTVGKTTIPAINHNNTYVEDSRVVNCEEYGYTHYVCPDCGDEYIKGYKPATGHDWVLNEDASVAPDCTTDGKNVYDCGNLGCTKEETVPATGHKNKAGETIVDDCMDTVEDRDCVNCETTVGKSHNETFTVSVPATCKDYGYDLAVCVKCEASTVTNVDDTYLADHTFCDWYVTVEPTFTEGGKAERKCSVCGLVETKDVAAKTGIEYVLDIDNAVVSGAGYADSSTVAVKVSLNSAKVDVWGLTFDLVYDEDVMTFVSAEFVSENFITAPMAHDNGGYVSVIASVPNAADQTTQNVTIEGTEEFVILYFTINNAVATETEFSFGDCEARNNKGELINSAGETESIEIRKFMDVNNDGDVNMADALIAYQIIVGEIDVVYDVTLDVNKDGAVDMVDFIAIYEYLVGAKSYEDMVNLAA